MYPGSGALPVWTVGSARCDDEYTSVDGSGSENVVDGKVSGSGTGITVGSGNDGGGSRDDDTDTL
jgi:hypothetical protein